MKPNLRLRLTIVTALCFSAAACSAGDGEEQEDSVKSAQKKCLDFRDLYCKQVTQCWNDEEIQLGRTPTEDDKEQFSSGCSTRFNQSLDCSDVVQVKPGYDLCLEQTQESTCQGIINGLPAACDGVLLISESEI